MVFLCAETRLNVIQLQTVCLVDCFYQHIPMDFLHLVEVAWFFLLHHRPDDTCVTIWKLCFVNMHLPVNL